MTEKKNTHPQAAGGKVQPIGRTIAMKRYFNMSQHQAVQEIRQLTEDDKQEIAVLIAEDTGWTVKEVEAAKAAKAKAVA